MNEIRFAYKLGSISENKPPQTYISSHNPIKPGVGSITPALRNRELKTTKKRTSKIKKKRKSKIKKKKRTLNLKK